MPQYTDALRPFLEVRFVGLLPFPAAGAMHRSRREVSSVENELDQREAHLLWALAALPAPLRPPLPPVNSCTCQHNRHHAITADSARREYRLPVFPVQAVLPCITAHGQELQARSARRPTS